MSFYKDINNVAGCLGAPNPNITIEPDGHDNTYRFETAINLKFPLTNFWGTEKFEEKIMSMIEGAIHTQYAGIGPSTDKPFILVTGKYHGNYTDLLKEMLYDGYDIHPYSTIELNPKAKNCSTYDIIV